MSKLEVECDVEEQTGKFQCDFKKDGKVVDRIVGKDFSQVEQLNLKLKQGCLNE